MPAPNYIVPSFPPPVHPLRSYLIENAFLSHAGKPMATTAGFMYSCTSTID